VDFSKFKTPDWLIIGGAIGIFIFGFFNWVTISAFGISDSGGNVFDFFWTGTIPWILLIAAAVITVLLALDVLKRDQAPWPIIILAATCLAALLLVLRLIFNPIEEADIIEDAGGSVGRGIGMILSTIAGVVAAVGGVMNFTANGGDFKDLTDVNKLKSSFSKGDDAPPPPPPPAPPAADPPPPPMDPPAGDPPPPAPPAPPA
jgi:hypothetical protein